MRKKLSIIIILLLTLSIITFLLYENLFSYKSAIRKSFGIDLSNIKLEKIREDENWAPNGDGVKIQIFKYDNFNESYEYLDKLPLDSIDLPPNEIPKEFINLSNGYYRYVPDKKNNMNFDLLIIDTLNKSICVYYQIM